MTGIGSMMQNPYLIKRSSSVPRSARQVVAGFVANDKEHGPGADVSKMRRALRTGSENLVSTTPVSVVDNMKLYSQALKNQRKASEETGLAVKKLKYSFKKISSRIINSRTSTAAREVVSQAKREIQKLKAAKRTGKYDEEELAAALDHAKSMERIARKKARHLEEEEMAKRCLPDNGDECSGTGADGAEADEKDPVREETDKIRKDLGRIEERAGNEEYTESESITNEMLVKITDGMEEMLDAIDELNDIMDDLVSDPTDMKPEDIRAMITRHRNREMKEITKADAGYLKAVFEHFENERTSETVPASVPAIDVAL